MLWGLLHCWSGACAAEQGGCDQQSQRRGCNVQNEPGRQKWAECKGARWILLRPLRQWQVDERLNDVSVERGHHDQQAGKTPEHRRPPIRPHRAYGDVAPAKADEECRKRRRYGLFQYKCQCCVPTPAATQVTLGDRDGSKVAAAICERKREQDTGQEGEDFGAS